MAVRDEVTRIAEKMPVVVEEVAVIVDAQITVPMEIVTPVTPLEGIPVIPAKTIVFFAKETLLVLPMKTAIRRKTGVPEEITRVQAPAIRYTPMPGVGHKSAGYTWVRGDRVRGRRHEDLSRRDQGRK